MLYCFSELKYSIHYFFYFLKYILLLKITSVLKAKLIKLCVYFIVIYRENLIYLF